LDDQAGAHFGFGRGLRVGRFNDPGQLPGIVDVERSRGGEYNFNRKAVTEAGNRDGDSGIRRGGAISEQ